MVELPSGASARRRACGTSRRAGRGRRRSSSSDERDGRVVCARRAPSAASRRLVARLADLEDVVGRALEHVARLALDNPHKLRELRAALPGWDDRAARRRRLSRRRRGDLLRERAGEGAVRRGRGAGRRVGARRGLRARGRRRSAAGPGLAVRALRRTATASARCSRSSRASSDRARALRVRARRRSRPDGEELRATGRPRGRIAPSARGAEGFGFDPVFVPEGEARTVAELGDDWKRENSHRARPRPEALLPERSAVAAQRQSGSRLARPADCTVGHGALRRPPGAELPVDLGAEDDHVRHHVEPDEQDDRRRRAPAARARPVRHAHVERKDLERRPRARPSRRARRAARRASAERTFVST